MPKDVDPNAEDPWKFTVVDDCLYVFLPKGESPAEHLIDAACDEVNYTAGVGGNSAFYDWQDAGLLRPDWPAVRVYRTELDFGDGAEPLWQSGPSVQTQGFDLDPADPTGRTLRLADEVRLDAGDPPGQAERKDADFPLLRGRHGRAARASIASARSNSLPTAAWSCPKSPWPSIRAGLS